MAAIRICMFALVLLSSTAYATTSEASLEVRTWLSEMEAFYEAKPQLKSEPGSGWKPYNRAKWFYEDRLDNGGLPDPARRWEVSEARRERENLRDAEALRGWFSVGPTGMSGRILDIAFHPTDPDILYVASASGGLWKSVDGGLSYATSTDQLPVLEVGAVAVLPWNPDVVLLGSGEGNGAGVWGLGMLRSEDAGETWEQTSLSYEVNHGHGFNAIEVNPTTGTILAAARDGLWRSLDEGQNWFRIAEGPWWDVVWKPGDPNTVYAVKGFYIGEAGVYVSTNDGLSFALAGTGQPGATVIGNSRLGVTADDPETVYVHFVNRNTSQTLGIYRSADGGASWEARNTTVNMTGGQGWYNVTMAVDPDDSSVLIAGGVRLYRSTDGGVNWVETGGNDTMGTATDVHVDHHAAVYQPGFSDVIWVGTDGGVWRSEDDGLNFEERRAGLVTYQFYDIAVAQTDPIFMMGGTQDNGVPGRTELDSWFSSTLYADGMVTNISPLNHNHVYSEWQFGNHVRSYDGGQGWTTIMNGLTGNGAWVAPTAENQIEPHTLFTATSDGIFKTTTGGSWWYNVAGHGAKWISICPVDGDVVWTVSGNLVKGSQDGGDTWFSANTFGFATFGASKVTAHPSDPATVFVTFYGYSEDHASVAVSHDYGYTWLDATGDLPAHPTHCIAVDPLRPNDWYIGTETGVWYSNNAGANWTPHGDGLPHVQVLDLEINGAGRKLVAGTYGRGAWEINLPEPTSVGDQGWSAASRRLMLDAPYPNPVAGSTTLRFASRAGASTSLSIFDARGRLIERVATVPGDGIIRTVDWRPVDLASGVYMAVLQSGEERVSQKLILSR